MCFGGGSAKTLFSIKTHIHLRNPENKSPGPYNDCPGLKIDPQAFKMTAHLGVEMPRRSDPRAQRNGTAPSYAHSALDIHVFMCIWQLMQHIQCAARITRHRAISLSPRGRPARRFDPQMGSDFESLGINFEARAVILGSWTLIFRISEMDVCFY